MFLNLVSNASKFTQMGGQIAVRIAKQDSFVLTEVSDNGPGIPEEDQKFIGGEPGSRSPCQRGVTPLNAETLPEMDSTTP